MFDSGQLFKIIKNIESSEIIENIKIRINYRKYIGLNINITYNTFFPISDKIIDNNFEYCSLDEFVFLFIFFRQ